MKTVPLNNNVLVEVLRDDDGVSRTDENESLKYGRLADVSLNRYHMTASAFGRLDDDMLKAIRGQMVELKDKIVRWEEFAEGGQTFEEDGKTYALIPWWRLISYEENEDGK